MAHDLVMKAKEKRIITKYSGFCKTELSNEYAIDDEEIEQENEWEKLCNECTTIIKESEMTEEDINEIVKQSKIF